MLISDSLRAHGVKSKDAFAMDAIKCIAEELKKMCDNNGLYNKDFGACSDRREKIFLDFGVFVVKKCLKY